MRNDKLAIYYRDDMVPPVTPGNYSQSPNKPRRFMEFLKHTPVWPHVQVRGDFDPLGRDDLLLAHTPDYVDAFLTGQPRNLAESNSLRWSPEFRDSVLLANGCLLAAISEATLNPERLTMAPVSGFHHARPTGGSGFCTFSGQVIAALKLYSEKGLRGCWIDLDGHFGNSIEGSRKFAPDLNEAIHPLLNINPNGEHRSYLTDLSHKLLALDKLAANRDVDYVCFAHGADSHEWDQLGHQCTTAEWLEASDMVYRAISRCREYRPMPVTLALFGGYRDDHPESVLGLHAMDTARCLAWMDGERDLLDYSAEVRAPA